MRTECEQIIDKTAEVGDKLLVQYEETKDLKVVQTALDAYKTAINASKAQLIYKKLTGKPNVMQFFE